MSVSRGEWKTVVINGAGGGGANTRAVERIDNSVIDHIEDLLGHRLVQLRLEDVDRVIADVLDHLPPSSSDDLHLLHCVLLHLQIENLVMC